MIVLTRQTFVNDSSIKVFPIKLLRYTVYILDDSKNFQLQKGGIGIKKVTKHRIAH